MRGSHKGEPWYSRTALQPVVRWKTLDFRVGHRRAHGARTANDPPVHFQLRITGPDEGLLVHEGKDSDAIRVSMLSIALLAISFHQHKSYRANAVGCRVFKHSTNDNSSAVPSE